MLDRDAVRLVQLLVRDLSSQHEYVNVCEAMIEIGRPEDALTWARRGISETTGWQVTKLYDLAAGIFTDREQLSDVVELRREHHQRMPNSTTYAALEVGACCVLGVVYRAVYRVLVVGVSDLGVRGAYSVDDLPA